MRTFEWAIEDVLTAHPRLFLEHHVVMAVALMSQYSESPCEFAVDCKGVSLQEFEGDSQFRVRVSWNDRTALDAARIWQTEQRKPIIERAAIAVAALVLAHLLPEEKLRVTEEGGRADFWLTQMEHALEVSGTEQIGELPRRVREKATQMLANPERRSGHVIVCCFSAVHSRIGWSYHVQED